MPGLRKVIGVGGTPAGWADWRGVLGRAPDPTAEAAVGLDTVSSILFTSGTTARPKGAVHVHRTAIATGAIFTEILSLGPGEVLHHAVPFFTSTGAQIMTMMTLWSGCSMVVDPAFDQARMVQRMAEEGATVGLAVPSEYLFLLQERRYVGRSWDASACGSMAVHRCRARSRARWPKSSQGRAKRRSTA